MAQLFVQIGAKIGDLQKKLDQVERRIGRFSRKMERLGSSLTQAVTIPLVGLGAASVATFAQFDKLEKGLGAIAGNAEEGKKQLNDLLDVVKDVRTTIGLEDAARGSLQLQAVGLSADRAKEALRQLAIAATVSGSSSDDVAEVARQLAQAAAKGNILQQELRIILERIPALAGIIQQEFGTVTAEGLRDAGVSADQFISRLTQAISANERFANVQASLSKEIETFRINLQLSAKTLGESIARAINLQENLRKLSSFVDRVARGFAGLSDETQSFIVKAGLVLAAIGPVLLILGKLSSLIPILLIGVKNLAGAVGLLARAVAFLLSPVGLVIAGITALGAVIVYAYNQSSTFRRIINGVVDVVIELGNIAGDVVAKLAKGFAALVDFRFEDAFESFSSALTNINPIAGLAEEGGGRLGRAFKQGFEDESNRIETGLDRLKSTIFRATSNILPAAQDGGQAFANTAATVASQSGGGATGEVRKLREEFSALPRLETRDLIPESLGPTTRAVAEQVGILGLSLNNLGLSTESLIVLQERTQGVFERMQPLAQLLEGPIQQGFSGLFTTLIEGGQNAFGGFIKSLKNLVVQLGAAVATAAALSIFLNVITGGAAGGFGGVFKGLIGGGGFGSLFKLLPGFAEGGIVPPGFPNDTFPARLSSGEAIIPLSKLNEFGGSSEVTGEFRLEGDTLIAAVERAQRNKFRSRGL